MTDKNDSNIGKTAAMTERLREHFPTAVTLSTLTSGTELTPVQHLLLIDELPPAARGEVMRTLSSFMQTAKLVDGQGNEVKPEPFPVFDTDDLLQAFAIDKKLKNPKPN